MSGEKLDTRNPTSKLMLTILAGGASWEREIMLERQREGIAAAKDVGKYKGRAPTARNQSAQIKALKSEGLALSPSQTGWHLTHQRVARAEGQWCHSDRRAAALFGCG